MRLSRLVQGAAALALAATLAACAPVPQAAAVAPSPSVLTYTDLTDDFARLFDEGAAKPAAERAAHIRAGMEAHLPGFYDPARAGDAAAYERRMADYMVGFPGQREAIAAVARRFGTMFDPAIADFEQRIGPLPTDVPVALVVSMGEFDGATRDLRGRSTLLFGADMIAQYHGGEARAFVQHELFHIYHGKRFAGCGEVWCALWNEGLATHAAQQLNPGASDAELLLTIPQPIRPALAAHRQEAVCMTLARLDSADWQDRAALFSNGRLSPNLPPRFGYLVGLWVAEELGRGQRLAEMAAWSGPQLRQDIEGALRRLASCP